MVTTIVLGLVVLGVVVVVLALSSLARNARPLRRAARRLGWRAEEGHRLHAKAVAVQQRVAELQREVEATQAKAAAKASNARTGPSNRGARRPGEAQ
jgi:hypothetical protein